MTTLYWDRAILEDDLKKLEAEGFESRRFSGGRWAGDPGTIHADLKSSLGFPDYYGQNLDALSECLKDDLKIDDGGGLVLVIEDADELAPAYLNGFLDVFADAARWLQVCGTTLLVLIQSNDPDLDLGSFGRTAAMWNPKEFLRASRK
jgi:hypothetical protein